MLAASLASAFFVMESAWFWRIHAALPELIRSGIFHGAAFVLRPWQSSDVYDQEQQLEFFLAWLFAATALMTILTFGRAIRERSRGARELTGAPQ